MNNLINREDRDKPPKEMVDGTKMPDMAIAEMVCDWQSMSDELKKNTTREWADRNINVRWKFNENQTKLIYDIIESIEGDLEIFYCMANGGCSSRGCLTKKVWVDLQGTITKTLKKYKLSDLI